MYPSFPTIEHIVPLIEGGGNEQTNLALACHEHNR
jgi:5-methylcytosine-specific restriction endonuclease McrA